MAALDDLIAIYKEAQLALIKIITGNTGAGTKTYYNTILRQLTALLNQLAAQTGCYISTEIPKEYKAALEQTYDYFKRNNLQMNRPEMFAQIHSDAVSELAAEMQHHITEGISSAGRRVMRYADIARDNALRQNGLRASAVKIASAQTVRDMQKDLIRRLSEDGFLTVQYGSGKYAYQVGLDSYAAMVARSTTREAGNLAREKQLLANGYDLVVITEHKPCCELCARVQGRVFSISGKDKRFPPLSAAFTSGYRNVHPNCRCVAVPWIEEMQSPEELRAAIAKGSQPLKDERSAKEKALYTKEQAERRQLRADRLQFERYKARLGDDAPQTFSAFRRIKNEDGDRWEGLQKEYRQRFESVHNPSIDKSENSGTIDIEVDEFVPCLKDAETGEILPTEVARIPRKRLREFTEADGWGVDWKDRPKDEYTLGVFIKGEKEPQGLISLRNDRGGTYMGFASTAPQNNKQLTGGKKKYIGVGGHLFAAAIEESVKAGNGGYVYGFAANADLLKYYVEKLGAYHFPMLHPYQIVIEGEAAQNLIDTYNYERRR